MSRTNNTLINTFAGSSVKIINVLLNFIMRTAFIYCLGAEYNGVSSLFTDVLMVLSFAELGIASAITFELYKPLAEHDADRIGRLMGFYKKAYRMVAAGVLGIGLLLVPIMDHIVVGAPNIKENIILIYVLYLVNASASYLLVYKSTLLIAAQKKYIVSGVEISVAIIKTLLQCIFLIAFRQFISYLLIMITATVVQNLIISKKVDQQYPFLKDSTEKLERPKVKKLFRDIAALSMYKVAGSVLGGIDSAIISMISGTVVVGYIANYKLILKGIDGILFQFYNAIEPSIGNLAVETDEEKQYHIFKLINLLTFCISSFCSAAFLVLLNPFVNLWIGKESVLPHGVTGLLVLDFYIVMMIRPVASFRTGNGLFAQGKYRPLLMALLNVILSVVLGIRWNIAGVLAATVISRLVTQVWYDPYLVYSRVFKTSWLQYWKKYLPMLLIASGTCFVAFQLAALVHCGNAFVEFLLKALVCAASSSACLLAGLVWKKEFRELAHIIKKQLRKLRKA